MITVKFNGESISIIDKFSIENLLDMKKVNADSVIIAYNLSIVNAAKAKNILLKDGDSVEIFRFVAGG